MVLLVREEYILWILTGETLYIQRVKHVTLEKFLWTEKSHPYRVAHISYIYLLYNIDS